MKFTKLHSLVEESRNEFFADLSNWGVHLFERPIYYKEYPEGLVKLELQPTPTGVRLSHIGTVPNKMGLGSKFLKELIAKAKEHSATISGTVQAEDGGPSSEKLKDLYQKVGFEVKGDHITWPREKLKISGKSGFSKSMGADQNDLVDLRSKYDWVVIGKHNSGWEYAEDAIDAIMELEPDHETEIEYFKDMSDGEEELADEVNDALESMGVDTRLEYTGGDEDETPVIKLRGFNKDRPH